MDIVKFRAAHLNELVLQDAQQYFYAEIADPAYGQSLESGYAFTAKAGDKVMCCAGAHEVWSGRALLWALVSRDAGPHFMALHRAAIGFVAHLPWRRVEAQVEHGFEPGHRWMRMLGMEHEGRMRAFSPTGADFHLYARVK